MKTAKRVDLFGFPVGRARIVNPLKSVASWATAVLCLMFVSASAFASCGLVAGARSAEIKLPALAHPAPPIGVPETGDSSIVGLWQTRYTTGGAVFAVTFKQWHSDGTEIDNIDQNPAVGSVCMGLWKQVSPRTVRLHHVGWVFASDGSPAGSFTIDETDTLGDQGTTYSGTFTFRTYDVNGNFTGTEVTGDTSATRITVN